MSDDAVEWQRLEDDEDPAADDADSDGIDWNTLAWVVNSKYRRRTLLALDEQPQTPSELRDELEEPVSHLSRAIARMRDRDLVELLVSEDTKRGRIYGLADRGERTVEALRATGRAEP